MAEKKHYFEAEIKVTSFSVRDLITTSDNSPLGKEDWDDGGWTTTVSD